MKIKPVFGRNTIFDYAFRLFVSCKTSSTVILFVISIVNIVTAYCGLSLWGRLTELHRVLWVCKMYPYGMTGSLTPRRDRFAHSSSR